MDIYLRHLFAEKTITHSDTTKVSNVPLIAVTRNSILVLFIPDVVHIAGISTGFYYDCQSKQNDKIRTTQLNHGILTIR